MNALFLHQWWCVVNGCCASSTSASVILLLIDSINANVHASSLKLKYELKKMESLLRGIKIIFYQESWFSRG